MKISTTEEYDAYRLAIKHIDRYGKREHELAFNSLPAKMQEYLTDNHRLRFEHFTSEFIYDFILKKSGLTEDPNFKTTLLEIIKGLQTSNKGILLFGGVGCGKTTLLKALTPALEELHQLRKVELLASYHIAAGVSKEGFNYFNMRVQQSGKIDPRNNVWRSYSLIDSNLIIDDMGNEPLAANYGATINGVEHLILRRYDEEGIFTCGSTNITSAGLKQFYGERAFSRIKEMMTFIEYKGNDRRK